MSVRVIVRAVAWPGENSQLWLEKHSREAARLLSEFLMPSAAMAFLLALWRVTADLGWTTSFVFAEGMLYHWQVWLALSLGLGAAHKQLANRL
ncbi:MAG: hypothetical protein OHK0021_25070 [Bryobacter sp.]|nr:hypothetical protein [Bryobacter sp.]